MKLIYSVHKFDVLMFTRLLNARIHSNLAMFSRYISRTGDGHLYVVLGLYLYMKDGMSNQLLQTLLLAFLLERPLYFVMKNVFKRNRPQAALKGFKSLVTPSDLFSFPSGHTSAAFMVAVIVGFYFPVLFFPLIIWAVLVGLSRVVLGVHFPTDTLVGMVLGSSIALISINEFVV